MKLKKDNLFKDSAFALKEGMPYSNFIDVVSHGSHLYGYILMPGAEFDEKHPCVLMFHGFPGYTTNNDLEHALRRMGCAVLHVNHRGSWGSEGVYNFTNLIEDAISVAQWVKSDAVVNKYQIDVNNIFLVGHSMGGMTVINTLRKLDFVKGAVAIAPYDLAYPFEHNGAGPLNEMIELEGRCLKKDNDKAIFQNAVTFYKDLKLENAYEDIKDRNIFLIGADFDEVAPPEQMLVPLWHKLARHKTQADQKYIALNTNHNLCGVRITLAENIGEWIMNLVIQEEVSIAL